MLNRAWVIVLGLSVVFAGCIGGTDILDPEEPAALPFVVLGNQTAELGTAARFGGKLAAAGEDAPCRADNCIKIPFRVGVPDPAYPAGALVVTLSWPFEDTALVFHEGEGVAFSVLLELKLFGADGQLAAMGESSIYAAVAVLERPHAEEYTLQVRAVRGETAFRGAVHLEAPAAQNGATVDLLPDLVTLPLTELKIEYPPGFPYGMVVPEPVGKGLLDALGVKGCGLDEFAESQHMRCLRFSNGISNIGSGPMEVRMPVGDGPHGLTGEARFTQRIHRSDGTHTDREAGQAEYHTAHAHFHYSGFASIGLYSYDLDTMARGGLAREGEKLGYCFFDLGLHDVGIPGTRAPVYDLHGCLDPVEENAWVNGISPAWYDVYIWSLPHQYIDITGLADGIYELVSIANHDHSLLETDHANNEASVVFRLTGDNIEVLHRPSGEPWWLAQ